MNWNYCFLDQITEEQYNNIYNSLSPSRLAHISRFKKEEDLKRSLAGEFLIKKILTEDFGIENPIISRNEKGQPIIENTDIFISISHSGDLAVAAADRKPIGIDAEKIKPRNLKLAEKICLPEEKEYIFSSEDNILNRFYEIWTGKEAYFKKTGTGITDFKSVNVLNLDRYIFTVKDYLIQII